MRYSSFYWLDPLPPTITDGLKSEREKKHEEEEEEGSIITLEHIRLPGFVLLTTSGVNTI